jgi:hypothetical protein
MALVQQYVCWVALQVSQHSVPLRGLEEGLQGEADLHVTQGILRDLEEEEAALGPDEDLLGAAADEFAGATRPHRRERSRLLHVIAHPREAPADRRSKGPSPQVHTHP